MNVLYRGCIEDDKRKLTGLQFIFPGVTLFYIEVSSTTPPSKFLPNTNLITDAKIDCTQQL